MSLDKWLSSGKRRKRVDELQENTPNYSSNVSSNNSEVSLSVSNESSDLSQVIDEYRDDGKYFFVK